jgi:hypothetical protein
MFDVSGLTRAELVRRGTVGGAALLVAGPAFAPEARAGTASDNDLAYARLLLAAELLALDFYGRVLRPGRFGPSAGRELARARADERKHYRAVARILLDAGQTPAGPGDIDFTYPERAFASRASSAALGVRLELLFLSACLGAVQGFDAGELKTTAARIAACEAQHLSLFAGEAGGERIGAAFPRPWTIDRASNALDQFTA